MASHAGIDGVGIGTRMHYSVTEVRGGLNAKAMHQALKIRDEASRECLGQAARLLARLDILASRGTLVHKEDELRVQLYNVLRNKDMNEAERLKKELARVCALVDEPDDSRNA
jgi:hypothetical protein